MITLPTASTALILIDLQKGIAAYPLAPYSFEAVLAKGKELARRFRVAKAPVVLVNVAFAPDFSDALKAPVERPMQAPPGGFPEDWSELADGLAEASDLKVTKRQWGAFYGTDLDLQLRRRGVTTVVIGGVATNIAWSRPPAPRTSTATRSCWPKRPPRASPPRCTPSPSSISSRILAGWRRPTRSSFERG